MLELVEHVDCYTFQRKNNTPRNTYYLQTKRAIDPYLVGAVNEQLSVYKKKQDKKRKRRELLEAQMMSLKHQI